MLGEKRVCDLCAMQDINGPKCFKISLAVISLWSKDSLKCLSFKMEAVIAGASGREFHSDLPLKPDQANYSIATDLG